MLLPTAAKWFGQHIGSVRDAVDRRQTPDAFRSLREVSSEESPSALVRLVNEALAIGQKVGQLAYWLLMVLKSQAYNDTNVGYYSSTELAQALGISPRSLRREIRTLKRAGYLFTCVIHDQNGHPTIQYQIFPGADEASGLSQNGQGGLNEGGGGQLWPPPIIIRDLDYI